MKTAAILFFAIVLCVQAISDDDARRQWQEFQEKYQKSYRSPVEAQKRYSIFKQTLEEIEEHNKLFDEGKVTWKEGINQFSDWTKEELQEYLNNGLLERGILLSAFSMEDDDIQRQWNEFQTTYKKTYRSPVEAKKRFEIFKQNVLKIEEHNRLYEQGLVSDKEGINEFSDWTEEEFENYIHKGLIIKGSLLTTDDDEIQRKWNEFQATYKKSYRSPVEAKKRFEIFKQNVLKIEEHNRLYEQGLVSDKEGINEFSDWTEEEFEDYIHKGLIIKGSLLTTEDDEIQSEWEEFQATYKKSYRSPVEAKKRFEIFKQNVLKIEEHNRLYEQGLVSDKEGINEFSDWTEEEFEDYIHKGLIIKDSRPASEDDEIQRKWNDFQATYWKSYRSPVEAKKRFEIFRNNVIKMEEHNDLYEQGLVSYKMGINRFSDWTEEEFKDYVNHGLKHDVGASEDDDILRRWDEFKKKYGRSYKTAAEEKKRFEIFKENVKKIDQHNADFAQGKTTFEMEINEFTDWTTEELRKWLIGH